METTEATGKQKVLSIISHIGYLASGVGFFIVPVLIYIYFKESDSFIAHNARQAYIAQLMMFLLSLPLFFIVLIAGDNAEAFGDGMSLVGGLVLCAYLLFYLLMFFGFFFLGSIYAAFRNACGHEARYLPVMIYDKLFHDDARFFPGILDRSGEEGNPIKSDV